MRPRCLRAPAGEGFEVAPPPNRAYDFHWRLRLPVRANDRIVVVVDDGLASGITMTAAVKSVRSRRAREIVVAVPVASATAVENLESVADRVITCATVHQPKFYVADYYRYWLDVADEDVLGYLAEWRARRQPRFGADKDAPD